MTSRPDRPTSTPDAFRPGAQLGGAHLANLDLSGVNLTGADLHAIQARNANFTGANLSRADLSGADLRRATLAMADLTAANVRGADLSGANLVRANLTGADLTGSDLSRANLTQASLTGARLDGASLWGTILPTANASSGPTGTEAYRARQARQLRAYSPIPSRSGADGDRTGVQRVDAVTWAQDLLGRDDWVILDTETTGLTGFDQIIEVAIVDRHGRAVVNSRMRPTVSISDGARRVHGISEEALRTAPTYAQLHPRVAEAISNATVVAYNAPFDRRLLDQTANAFGIELPEIRWECAMQRHREVRGAERGGLKGGDHSALGDCLAVLRLIQTMAAPR